MTRGLCRGEGFERVGKLTQKKGCKQKDKKSHVTRGSQMGGKGIPRGPLLPEPRKDLDRKGHFLVKGKSHHIMGGTFS